MPLVIRFLFVIALSFGSYSLAQKSIIQGAPLSISVTQSQTVGGPTYIALVLWDGQQKILVRGAVKDPAHANQIEALVEAEMNDGDDQVISVECNRRPPPPTTGKIVYPGPEYRAMTMIQIEGYTFRGDVWFPF